MLFHRKGKLVLTSVYSWVKMPPSIESLKLNPVERKAILATLRICYRCEQHISSTDITANIPGLAYSLECGCFVHLGGCGKPGKPASNSVHAPSSCSTSNQHQLICTALAKKFPESAQVPEIPVFGFNSTERRLHKFVEDNCASLLKVSKEICVLEKRRADFLKAELETLRAEVGSNGHGNRKQAGGAGSWGSMARKVDQIFEMTKSVQDTNTELITVRSENEKLLKERDEAIEKCDRALAAAREKSVQLESVTNQINQLKAQLRQGTGDCGGKEGKEVVTKSEDWHKEDEAVLSMEWNTFKGHFDQLHTDLTGLLLKSVSARDSRVLSSNLDIVRDLTTVADDVRDKWLATTRECSGNIEDVRSRLLHPLPSLPREVVSSQAQSDNQLLE